MITRLISHFTKPNDTPAILRQRYGAISGGMGFILNLLLFLGKFLAGQITGSMAITVDAFNNLSDAGSSVVTFIGFRMANQRPDASHPFGHGRIEYLSGLFVSVAILFVGLELIKTSIGKIFTPEIPIWSILSIVILVISIFIKLWMFFFNRTLGKIAKSTALQVVAKDSLCDAAATFTALLSAVLEHWTHVYLDGYFGVIIALFILYTGFSSAKDTINPLLGQSPDPELIKDIKETVLRHPDIRGIHDLIIHDYGPDRMIISLHAEIPECGELLKVHHAIDCAERDLKEKFGCIAVIHMDPVATDDQKTQEMQEKISALVQLIDPAVSIHDFRMTSGGKHTKLIFDVVVPYQFRLTDAQIISCIQKAVSTLDSSYEAVVEVDQFHF